MHHCTASGRAQSTLLHRACDVHEPFLIFTLYGYPTTARLREDPRFAEVRERMGLPSPL